MVEERTPLVVANWKMNKNVAEARILITELLPGLQKIKNIEKVICPPFISLLPICALLEGTEIGLGSQNMHWEKSGAYTGEISPSMVAEFCHYVIIGHSERRQYFGETDHTVNMKVIAAIDAGLIPIVCVGESLDQFDNGLTDKVVTQQILDGLSNVSLSFGNKDATSSSPNLVIAYEPVWAIGTGRAATADGANDTINSAIRKPLIKLFGENITQNIRVLYGGSVNSQNAKQFFQKPEIDGALVGGASLKAEEFIAIVQAAVR